MPRFRRRFRRRRLGRRFRRRAGTKPPFRFRRWVKRFVAKGKETKILPILGGSLTMEQNETYVFNPTYQIGQGDGSGERIGRKITGAFCVIGFEASLLANSTNILLSTPSQHAYLRLLVVTSRAIKFGAVNTVPNNNPGGLTAGDIFYFPTVPVTSSVDKNRWTVVMDRMYSIKRFIEPTATLDNPNPSGPTILKRNIRVPLPKSITYRDDGVANSTLLQAETYIIWVASWYTGALNDHVFRMTPHGTIRFKDA